MEVEREEGEISDEEFENVSDSSISLNSILFEELSSISSSDDLSVVEIRDKDPENVSKSPLSNNKIVSQSPLPINKRRKAHETVSHKRIKYTRHHYDLSRSKLHKRHSDGSDESSSDSDDYISDRRLLRQLRDAVRISSTEKNANCSLRTRIKRMIDPESPSGNKSEEEDLENLRDQALKTKNTNLNTVKNGENGENQHTVTDEDLFNLRLVALQSAVLKKHENRQKRKVQQKFEVQEVEVEKPPDIPTEIEIINTDVVDSKISTISDVNIVNNDRVPENIKEEVQVEQIPPKSEEPVEKPVEKTSIEEDEDILRAMLLTSISKKIANKKNGISSNKELKLPKVNQNIRDTVKPLPPKNVIKQRSPIKRLIINVNSDSESDTNNESSSPEKKKPEPKKEIVNFEQGLSNLLKEARKKSEAQKVLLPQSDISKHLPKSQQIEYRKLKRKLHLLSKQNLLLKYKKANIDENKLVKKNILDNNSALVKKQFNYKLDRLHIKGKYESLVPLMNKITKAREARDTAQKDVTRLINELKEARTRLTTTHKTYTTLIKQLQQVKSGIDERGSVLTSRENKIVKPANSLPNVCTSTPLKESNNDNICDISSIYVDKINSNEESKLEKVVNITTSPVDNIVAKHEDDNVCENKDKEDKDKTLQDEPVIFPDVPEDSKDINKPSEDIIKYNSPLEHIQTNSDEYGGNPLSVLCPYDLLGVCRDPECGYRH